MTDDPAPATLPGEGADSPVPTPGAGSTPRLPLGPMEAFVAVARSGSLARAALAMNLTVPALSRRIQLLEAHLGVRLFDRLPRGVRLTEAGSAYHAALAPAWETLRVATEATRRQGRRTAIRVSVMPSFAATWLVPRLGRFHARHAAVEVEIHTSAEPEDLGRRTDLDCAIRLGKGPWPGLDCEAFLPVHAFAVASPALLEGARALRAPGDLPSRALIGTRHQPAFWREWFAAAGADMPTEPLDPRRSFDTLHLVYEAAAAGIGVALGLDPVVRPYLESGRLRPLFPDAVRLERSFHLVRRRGGEPPGRGFAQFREWLFAEAAAFAASGPPAS